jgi:ribosome-associated translation inhibitor RaiA
MNIDIQSLGFPITPALADHARRRLRFGLTRHSDRIQRIVVRLGDQNGPRGGKAMFCRIRVYLLDAPVAVIVDIGTDLYAVIDRTADRAGRVVVKHLDRSRSGACRVRGAVPGLFAEAFDPTLRSNHTEGERA